jgi:hypothetical protein
MVPVLVVTQVDRELQLPVLKPTKFAAKPRKENSMVMMNNAADFTGSLNAGVFFSFDITVQTKKAGSVQNHQVGV